MAVDLADIVRALICADPDCSDVVYAKGFCKKHWTRDWRERNRNKTRANAAAYYLRNRDIALARNRSSKLKTRYGITPEEKERLWLLQYQCCAICFDPIENDKAHVDHDHDTGEIRGLLCGPCNRGLGNLKDDIRTLESAISYLRDNQMTQLSEVV